MSGSRYELDSDSARALLSELGRRLARDGIRGDIRLVGGVALMFSGAARRTTNDVDASYAPKEEVERVAQQMAEELDLPADWLNDRAKAFIPDQAQWVQVDIGEPNGGIKISRASDDTLVAMKMAAERDGDIPDLAYLSRRLDLREPEDLVAIAFSQYGPDSIPLSGDPADYLIVAQEALSRAADEYDGMGPTR